MAVGNRCHRSENYPAGKSSASSLKNETDKTSNERRSKINQELAQLKSAWTK
jgi:hypothetical protein